jgi:Zn-dependent protease with chaperone function
MQSQTVFTGLYFDGRSSQGHPANILLGDDELLIQITDPGVQPQAVRWNVGDILPDELDDPKHVLLKYGAFPHQVLQVDGQGFFDELFATYPDAGFHKPRYHFVLGIDWKRLTVGLMLMAAVSLSVYFYVIPWAAERVAEQIPAEAERSLGDEAYKSLVKDLPVDKQRTADLKRYFAQLKISDAQPVEILVVNDSVNHTVNAFALPGGRIVVYKDILGEMDSYDELAALLAHEYAHVEKRHTMRSVMRSLSNYVLLTVLVSDMNAVSAMLVDQLQNLRSLSYSRGLEKEADVRGLEILQASGVDPDGMVRLFERLKKGGGDAIPEMVSTHPLLENRQEYIRAMAKEKDAIIGQNDSLRFYWERLAVPASEKRKPKAEAE